MWPLRLSDESWGWGFREPCDESWGFREQTNVRISKNLIAAARTPSPDPAVSSDMFRNSFFRTPSTIFITGENSLLAPRSSASLMRWAICLIQGRRDAEAAMIPLEATAISDASEVKTPSTVLAIDALQEGINRAKKA
jgi:hypothetical protein